MSGIFKAYDIRGIYPNELNENNIGDIAKAFLVVFKDKSGLKPGDAILVGNDVRVSGPQLKKTVVNTFLEAGFNVDDMGVATTDSFYFSAGANHYGGGVHIGASHNPPQYNGIKGVARNVDFIRGEEVESFLPQIGGIDKAATRGVVREVDLLKNFAKYTLEAGQANKLKVKRKIIFDPGNGTTVKLMPYMIWGIPVEPVIVNNTIDGTFPGRGPNPYSARVYEKMKELVLKNGTELGVAWDNDADRILFVDETGRPVPGDIMEAVLAPYMLEKNPGACLAHDVFGSRSVGEIARKHGGKTIRTRVGYVFVKQGMMRDSCIMGAEASGHFQYPVAVNGVKWTGENTWLTLINLLHLLQNSVKKFSQLVDEATLYHKSDVLTFELGNRTNKSNSTYKTEEIIETLKQKYPDGKQDTLDGLAVDYPDWWFCARPSNTEPILKLVVEAKTAKMLSEKVAELTALINQSVV